MIPSNNIAVICSDITDWMNFLRKVSIWFLESGAKGSISMTSRIIMEGYRPASLYPVYQYHHVQGMEPTHFIFLSLPDECKDWEVISSRLRRCHSVLISYQELCKLYTPKIKVD